MSETNRDVAHRALKIAHELAHADSGEKAAARRMTQEGSPVFWRLVARLDIKKHEEEKWRRITKALALLTPASATESIHEKKDRDFGEVLADGGDACANLEKPAYSERRLARLLAARESTRLDALERAVRMLARSRPHINVPSLAEAYLNEDGRLIARAYFRRLDRHNNASQEEKSDV